MRQPRTVLLLLAGLLLVAVAGWLGGLSGLGLSLTALAAAGLGYAARQRSEPALETASAIPTEIGQTVTQPAAPLTEGTDLLALSQRVVEGAHAAPSLPQALYRVGQALSEALGAPSWICLRVEGWNGESALLRPWMDTGDDSDDVIDVTAIASTHKGDRPLGLALGQLRPIASDLASSNGPSYTWRPEGTRRVLALPVAIEGWPLALLEFDDPAPGSPAMERVLDIAAIQLGFVAQRDANLARMASHAEHLGRLGLVASRISSGVAITDRNGVIEWINSPFVALTGWPE